ncbi:hypothetical protein EV182_004083, partial [Spiromyces aspiralis]
MQRPPYYGQQDDGHQSQQDAPQPIETTHGTQPLTQIRFHLSQRPPGADERPLIPISDMQRYSLRAGSVDASQGMAVEDVIEDSMVLSSQGDVYTDLDVYRGIQIGDENDSGDDGHAEGRPSTAAITTSSSDHRDARGCSNACAQVLTHTMTPIPRTPQRPQTPIATPPAFRFSQPQGAHSGSPRKRNDQDATSSRPKRPKKPSEATKLLVQTINTAAADYRLWRHSTMQPAGPGQRIAASRALLGRESSPDLVVEVQMLAPHPTLSHIIVLEAVIVSSKPAEPGQRQDAREGVMVQDSRQLDPGCRINVLLSLAFMDPGSQRSAKTEMIGQTSNTPASRESLPPLTLRLFRPWSSCVLTTPVRRLSLLVTRFSIAPTK